MIAVQILNMSIDAPAAQAESSSSNFNYIDSYVEYITEVILKFENAIPESKNRQQKELQLHKHIEVICQVLKLPKALPPTPESFARMYSGYSDKYASRYIKEINPPPPKA